MVDYKQLANALINDMCELDGPIQTCVNLLCLGIDEEALSNELCFEELTVERAKERIKEMEE